ncbi:hypothetical protein ASC97_30550 [Rhizobium sp. Root1203]|nr:hypothetical protein ASC97_30550 [Rhizobium sp. Root1203]
MAQSHHEDGIDRLFEFLRIASVSSQKERAHDCMEAAVWLLEELISIGFKGSLMETTGFPIVLAKWPSTTLHAPHVLFYCHYDVQPAGPLEQWTSPPFDPHLERGSTGKEQIVARGASDDKGQLMTFIEACRSIIHATGNLPVNLTIVAEGEEEVGSPSLSAFLSKHASLLRSDVAFVCDGEMWDPVTPAIATSLRGILSEEVTITGAEADLHSGLYGGAVANPLNILSKLLASMHDGDLRVTIPGFYEQVAEPGKDRLETWNKLEFDEDDFFAEAGRPVKFGESQRTTLERIWARPTADIVSISGGYTAENFRTSIPSQAKAIVSFRLVGDQSPATIRQAFQNFCCSHLPVGMQVSYKSLGEAMPYATTSGTPLFDKVERALQDEWLKKPALIGSGGSIPAVVTFKEILGIDALLIGFGLVDDGAHSPNEKLACENYKRGIRSWIRIIMALGETA